MSAQGLNLEILMKQALAGDKQSYNQVLHELTFILRKYLSRKIHNLEEVEDILQEILISIHKARHTYDGERPLLPWVFAIAKFRLTDHLRKTYSSAKTISLDEVAEIEEGDVTNSLSFYESIKNHIDNLSGKQPQILKLIHFDGFTLKEVAGKLGMNESAVKVAAHRAYKILRVKLANEC